MELATHAERLRPRFQAARAKTLTLIAPLTPEDMMVQSCPEASPVKWHLAHTSWFFESFILREFLPGYRIFNADFTWLFNSYYQSFAAFPEKKLRSSFSRPAIEEILRYRTHVEEGIERLLESNPHAEALKRIELGVNHEEQHQELILTDILHALYTNPLRPAYQTAAADPIAAPAKPLAFLPFAGGLHQAGHAGNSFSFDNELPRHKVWLEPFALADRLVTCAEYAEFIADGGYKRPELWLSDGWKAVETNHWRAPLYWDGTETNLDANDQDSRSVFTLHGELPFAQVAQAPVSHVSLYEADAYARWAGYRLATEFEWESAAESQPVGGNLLDAQKLRPLPATQLVQDQGRAQHQFYGDCWEWTGSAYLPYPGFEPLPGSLGEYNGKFMSGQMVLRGGSCCTPAAHIRASYRNFFAPETRWQFSGIRLTSR
jgi:ergothioneine biosynthesis protein EgtB